MSEVKIYTVVSDELSPPVIGESFCTDMVRHSDYAALEKNLTDMAEQLANAESKCRELAAENLGLKAAAEFATAEDMWIEQADGMLDYRYVDWYVDVLQEAMQTPATDAFLAEVRERAIKSALDDCSEYLDRDCIMESNGISYDDAALREIGAIALQEALLRKGAAL